MIRDLAMANCTTSPQVNPSRLWVDLRFLVNIKTNIMNTNTNKSEAYLAQARRANIAAVMRGRQLTLAAMKAAKRDSKPNLKPLTLLSEIFANVKVS